MVLEEGQEVSTEAPLVVLDAAPLSAHRNFCSIETPMQTGRNETWFMSHGGFGCTGQQLNESLLIRGVHGEDIDQRDELKAG